MRVSQSRVKTWRKCRRAYHYKYVEGLRRKSPGRPLKFGSLMHRMMEHNINGKNFRRAVDELSIDETKLFEDEAEEYGNVIQDATDIMTDYRVRWKRDKVRYLRFAGQRAEHELEFDIAKGIIGVVKLDFVAQTENDRFWLGDHKTYKSELTDEQLWRNIQSVVYHNAWEQNSTTKLSGTLWDMIWSKPPGEPKLTQKGVLSRAALVSLPSVVSRFIQQHPNLEADERAYLEEVALDGERRYFKRVFMPRDKGVEKMMFADFVDSARDIVKGHGKDTTHNIDRHCDWCEFKNLCQARLLGLDYKFVERNQYAVDETRKNELHDAASNQ